MIADRARYSLADVRRSYTPEKAWAEMEGDFPCYLIYRPIAFYVAVPLLALRVPILAVTLSSLVLALAMVTVAWMGAPTAAYWVAGLAFAFHVIGKVLFHRSCTERHGAQHGGVAWGVIGQTEYQIGELERVGLKNIERYETEIL